MLPIIKLITNSIDDTLKRLKRIQGQIKGLITMVDKEDDCDKIVIPFQAAKEALNSAFTQHLFGHLEKCMQKKNTSKIEKLLKLAIKQ